MRQPSRCYSVRVVWRRRSWVAEDGMAKLLLIVCALFVCGVAAAQTEVTPTPPQVQPPAPADPQSPPPARLIKPHPAHTDAHPVERPHHPVDDRCKPLKDQLE